MPWIGAAISGGINVAKAVTGGNVKGGLLEAFAVPYGSKLVGKQPGDIGKTDVNTALANQIDWSTETGKRLVGEGETSLQSALDYWMPLLTGDRTRMEEAIAPEKNTLLGLYDTAQRQVSELQPRGGARSGKMAELPFAKIGGITDMLLKARQGAAEEVSGIGGQLMAGGLGAAGITSQDLLALLQSATTKRGQTVAALGAAGSAVGTALYTFLKAKYGG